MNKIIAHIDKNRIETLKEHEIKTEKYAKKIFEIKNNIKCSNIIIDAIKKHDRGKINKDFQKKIRGLNNIDYADHSIISGAYFIQSYKSKKINLDLLLSLSYVISKHHSKLGYFSLTDFYENLDLYINNNIDELKEKLEYSENLTEDFYNLFLILEKYKNNFKLLNINKIIEKLNEEYDEEYFNEDVKSFIIFKFIYSLLISADYYATFDFFAEKEIKNFGRISNDKEYKKLFEKFEEKYSNLIKNPRTKINKIRTELSNKAIKNLKNNKNKKIFFLNAPTGAGKTLMSLNIVKNMDNIKKIFYIFPFNTIAEQTEKVFENYFETKYFKVINSITSIEDNNELTTEEILLKTDMLHYPIIITSTVNMFNILFGNNKKDNFNFWQLQNSVLIFDEVQSIPLKLLKNFIEYLEELTKLLNCKVILMSATLPTKIIENYIKDKSIIGNLLDENTLKIDIFKNRVKIDYLKNSNNNYIYNNFKNLIKEITNRINNIKNNNKILIEFYSKKTAIAFFELLKNYESDILKKYNIKIITGDTNKIERKKIIEEINNINNNIILISTQVIEAGIDIDMDIGFKQISIFESEEQFLGRINRNFNKKIGYAYFFELEESNIEKIIKDKERTVNYLRIKNKEIFNILINKDINKYYNELNNILSINKNINNNILNFSYSGVDFFEIYKKMKLIKDVTVSLFIPYKIELEKIKINNYLTINYEYLMNNCKDFIKNNNNNSILIDGSKFIEYYIYKILKNKNLTFIEKKKKVYELREIFNLFTFNVYKNYIEDIKYYIDRNYELDNIYILKKEFIDYVYDKENKIIKKDIENYELFI